MSFLLPNKGTKNLNKLDQKVQEEVRIIRIKIELQMALAVRPMSF